MRSQCIVPSCNVRQQKQEEIINKGEERNRSSHSHVDFSHSHSHSLQHHHQQQHITSQMSNFEVTELTWENGQLAMHELGGMFPPTMSTTAHPMWEGGGSGAGETLEAIIHQAAYCNQQIPNLMPTIQQEDQSMNHVESVVASCGGKWADPSGPVQIPGPPPPSGSVKKRTRPEMEHRGLGLLNDHESACASQNAAFSRENNDTTMMTWSLESPRSTTRTKTVNDEDSASHGGSENQEEERETKGESGRSYTTRKGRAAAVHNQSERRRRDRINQKMKALQKLVPNSSKTDKASMLDEVIEYLKQLQAQLQMISHSGFMPQMMMPLGMQQHLQQMSLLARMGMGANLGMGIGMLESPGIGHTPPPSQQIPSIIHPNQVPTFAPPAFSVPQMIASSQQTNSDHGASSSAHLQDSYNTLLAQSMNIELCNRIAALQRQQQQQQAPSQPPNNRLAPNNHVQQI